VSVGMIVLLVFGGLASVALVATIAFVALFPAIGAARTMVYKRSCESNLVKIGLALRAYEAAHGTLPPAYIPDASGKPMHSWRVLILPYLDEQGLYSRYDLTSPGMARTTHNLPSTCRRFTAAPPIPTRARWARPVIWSSAARKHFFRMPTRPASISLRTT